MKWILIVVSCVTLFLALGLLGACGENSDEAKDNFDSQVACNHYCDKHFDCRDEDPDDDDRNDCVSACRDAIEDQCGNDHQEDANDKIEECVDKDCLDFGICMVFEAAPECFNFVDEN